MSRAKDSRRTRRRVFCIGNLHPCLTSQPVKDRRQWWLPTLFGTVDVEAPRYRICRCRSLLALMRRLSRPSVSCSQAVARPSSSVYRRRWDRYVVPRGRPDLGDVAACITSRPYQRPQSAPRHRLQLEAADAKRATALDCDVSLQDHHWQAPPRLDSAQSADRSEDHATLSTG